MSEKARKIEPTAPGFARASIPVAKKQKIAIFLVTQDESLWPQIGTSLNADMTLHQVDSIDELMTTSRLGQPAIVLWDARGAPDHTTALSRFQLHSARFSIVAVDVAAHVDAWKLRIQHRQVVAVVVAPVQANALTDALASAGEEVHARVALLGDGTEEEPALRTIPAIPTSKRFWPAALIGSCLLIACVVAVGLFRRNAPPVAVLAVPAAQTVPGGYVGAAAGADEKVDALLEKGRQAMRDRHFIEPTEGSALSLYHDVLIFDAHNGEAQQALQRLAQILFSQVQSALDARQFDAALLALETARSIDPADPRLSALDARVVSLRAELGFAQIQAALSAQNYERATQLIEDAARAKVLSGAKLTQLRDEARRRREESDTVNLVKLIDTRLQQDRLIDPPNDSAAFYLSQALKAGVAAAALQAQSQELAKRLEQAARGAIEHQRFAEVDRLLNEARSAGVSAAAVTSLQHDLGVARSQQERELNAPQQFLSLAQARLAQGQVLEPEKDNALFYVNQLRNLDPKNTGLAQISSAVQTAILARIRTALDAAQLAKAESLLPLANSLGASSELNMLTDKLAQAKLAAAAPPEVLVKSLSALTTLAPDYPQAAIDLKVEGWVALAFTVAADGKVTNVSVLEAMPRGVFEEAATKALLRMRYRPVIQGGQAVAVSTKVRVAFHLHS
ncbi:MAG: energy transducer TonB [Pseudomonadota bacterium]|nr:energy transducer TonB [Pseudomonadota bacterium]